MQRFYGSVDEARKEKGRRVRAPETTGRHRIDAVKTVMEMCVYPAPSPVPSSSILWHFILALFALDQIPLSARDLTDSTALNRTWPIKLKEKPFTKSVQLIRYNLTSLVTQVRGQGQRYFRDTEPSSKCEVVPRREIPNNGKRRTMSGKDDLFCLQCSVLKKWLY